MQPKHAYCLLHAEHLLLLLSLFISSSYQQSSACSVRLKRYMYIEYAVAQLPPTPSLLLLAAAVAPLHCVFVCR
jgi:hypothetical protein